MNDKPKLTYTNPRREDTIRDWPIGRGKRGYACFYVETHPTRGERMVRETYDSNHKRLGAAKKMTYADRTCLVDGSDGRTYIMSWSSDYANGVYIHEGTMRWNIETVRKSDDPERHAALLAMLNVDPSKVVEKGLKILNVTHIRTEGGSS